MRRRRKKLLRLAVPLLGIGAVSALLAFAPSKRINLSDPFGQDTWQPLKGLDAKRPEREKPMSHTQRVEYLRAIRETATMFADSQAQGMANHYGLDILNLTWEDTGRYKGSAVGPNISDMTIQVSTQDPSTRRFDVTCMPVIRFPNFSDLSCDLDPRDFTLLVGNEKGRALRRVSLHEFLTDPTRFMSGPASWNSARPRTLLAGRDLKVLVSAQACFLPVPKFGKATFNPVLFNYQSYAKNPAVLTILATREGTSMTVIDNKRDAFETGAIWGQRLFHNQNGMRASLTGQRLSDYRASQGSSQGGATRETEASLNMVLLIQVPLKQKARPRGMDGGIAYAAPMGGAGGEKQMDKERRSDVENAVIGHGELEGPFTEVDNLAIERNPDYPVRVTVQFYKATSNGVVSQDDMAEIKRNIDGVYKLSDSVGSLVTQGETGRITEYWGSKVQPAHWWEDFWRRYEMNMGIPRDEAIRRLMKLLGRDYLHRPVCELYLRDALRHR